KNAARAIARAALYLACDQSVDITGATLSVYQAALANKVFRMPRRDKNAARAIARAALYLACDQSVDITGAMVVVDADFPQWA
ncbi:MAG: hypothetical protein AAFR30_16860, partial [Cyanobacteria bacterium J06628_4]